MSSIRFRAGWAPLWLLLAAACTSEPGYPPPTEQEASAAFLRALRADWIERPAPDPPPGPTAIGPGDTPASAGRKAASVLDYETEMNSRAIARDSLDSFEKVALGACEWTSVDADDVRPHARHRLATDVEGYRCAYELFHQGTAQGRVKAKGDGYFFHREGGYDFAEIEQETFERVPD